MRSIRCLFLPSHSIVTIFHFNHVQIIWNQRMYEESFSPLQYCTKCSWVLLSLGLLNHPITTAMEMIFHTAQHHELKLPQLYTRRHIPSTNLSTRLMHDTLTYKESQVQNITDLFVCSYAYSKIVLLNLKKIPLSNFWPPFSLIFVTLNSMYIDNYFYVSNVLCVSLQVFPFGTG